MHKYAKGLHAATQRCSTPIPSFDLSLIPIPYSPDCPERPRRASSPSSPTSGLEFKLTSASCLATVECPTRNMLLCLRRALDSCSYYVFVSERGGPPLAALRPVSHRSERRLENGGGSGRDDRNPKGAQS